MRPLPCLSLLNNFVQLTFGCFPFFGGVCVDVYAVDIRRTNVLQRWCIAITP